MCFVVKGVAPDVPLAKRSLTGHLALLAGHAGLSADFGGVSGDCAIPSQHHVLGRLCKTPKLGVVRRSSSLRRTWVRLTSPSLHALILGVLHNLPVHEINRQHMPLQKTTAPLGRTNIGVVRRSSSLRRTWVRLTSPSLHALILGVLRNLPVHEINRQHMPLPRTPTSPEMDNYQRCAALFVAAARLGAPHFSELARLDFGRFTQPPRARNK